MTQTGFPPDHTAKWLRLHLTNQVGPRTFARLLDRLGGIDEVLGASAGRLATVPHIGPKKAELIAAGRDDADVETELALAEKLGVQIITIQNDAYPPLLRQISDPPHVLYVKGALRRQDELAVAIVGSRNCTIYGSEQASRLSHLLTAAGFTIVSGLARGIDTAAHRGALAAEGRTIAVQGCGLALVFPPENAKLAQQIIAAGALVSELPLTFEPLAATFPTRNRIISGLSLGTIIVEAHARSGALITAAQALEQNREVMAVPGKVDAPGSFGPHSLIRDGAKLITGIEDILDCLGRVGEILTDHAAVAADRAEQQAQPTLFDIDRIKLTDPERAILDCFDGDTVHIDELIARSNLPAGTANAAATSLQLKGIIRQLPGSYYQKSR